MTQTVSHGVRAARVVVRARTRVCDCVCVCVCVCVCAYVCLLMCVSVRVCASERERTSAWVCAGGQLCSGVCVRVPACVVRARLRLRLWHGKKLLLGSSFLRTCTIIGFAATFLSIKDIPARMP